VVVDTVINICTPKFDREILARQIDYLFKTAMNSVGSECTGR
jgi:hypothetical protein